MNVAPDQTIILGLQIFLDHKSLSSIGQKILIKLISGLQIFLGHRSLSSIGQNILIKLSHDETRFKKNKKHDISNFAF